MRERDIKRGRERKTGREIARKRKRVGGGERERDTHREVTAELLVHVTAH